MVASWTGSEKVTDEQYTGNSEQRTIWWSP